MILGKYSKIIYTTELVLGIIMLIAVSYLMMGKKVKSLENEILILRGEALELSKEDGMLLRFKSLNPVSLFLIGSAATICEIPTALRYFAFISIILNYELSVIAVVLIMLLYNFIYSSPLILLYFLYVMYQDKVDKFYNVKKEKMSKYSNILTPLVVGGIGVFLIYNSVVNLLS